MFSFSPSAPRRTAISDVSPAPRIPDAPPALRRSRGRGWWARIGVVGVLTAALALSGAGVASAHVTVNPPDATAGSYAKLTFRVPTESDTASTVSVQVSLPTDHPFASVSLQPVPGWTASTTTVTFDPPLATGRFDLTEAISSVTWAADDGSGVKPGEFQEFSISVGPVPDVAALTFPATQTYSDGSVVHWDEVAADGQDRHDLDHPAPLLTIAAAAQPGASGASASDASPSGTTASDTVAQILAAAALVVAAAALVFAALAWRRRAPQPVPEAAGTAGTAGTDRGRA